MSRIFNISMAILNCAEYNEEKLEAYGWPSPKSPEEALRRKLEMGMCKIILILDSSEKSFWAGNDCKYISKKLREELSKLLNNTSRERTEEECVAELVQGIEDGILYLQEAKENVSSKVFQHVERLLCKLQEMECDKVLITDRK